MANLIYTVELMNLSEKVDYLEDEKVYLLSLKRMNESERIIYHNIFNNYLIGIKVEWRLSIEKENNKYYACYYKLTKYTFSNISIPITNHEKEALENV